MKFYSVETYNHHSRCDWFCMAIADDEHIEDFTETRDKVKPIDRSIVRVGRLMLVFGRFPLIRRNANCLNRRIAPMLLFINAALFVALLWVLSEGFRRIFGMDAPILPKGRIPQIGRTCGL